MKRRKLLASILTLAMLFSLIPGLIATAEDPEPVKVDLGTYDWTNTNDAQRGWQMDDDLNDTFSNEATHFVFELDQDVMKTFNPDGMGGMQFIYNAKDSGFKNAALWENPDWFGWGNGAGAEGVEVDIEDDVVTVSIDLAEFELAEYFDEGAWEIGIAHYVGDKDKFFDEALLAAYLLVPGEDEEDEDEPIEFANPVDLTLAVRYDTDWSGTFEFSEKSVTVDATGKYTLVADDIGSLFTPKLSGARQVQVRSVESSEGMEEYLDYQFYFTKVTVNDVVCTIDTEKDATLDNPVALYGTWEKEIAVNLWNLWHDPGIVCEEFKKGDNIVTVDGVTEIDSITIEFMIIENDTYDIELKQAEGGTASVSYMSSAEGASVTLEVTELDEDYSFVSWIVESDLDDDTEFEGYEWRSGKETDEDAVLVMPAADITITPVYEYTEPETSDPETSDPETSDPETSDPETSEPGEDEPGEELTPEEIVENFITRMYKYVLGREPGVFEDAEGNPVNELELWAERLMSGEYTGSEFAYAYFFGVEFLSQEISNEEYVEILYMVMMGRDYKHDPLSEIHIGQLNDGMSRDAVLAEFLGSEEYAGICEEAGIEVGDPKAQPDEAVLSFVWRLYNLVLGRKVDQSELIDWHGRLTGKEIKGSAVAFDFFFDPEGKEYENRNRTNEQFVDDLYAAIMGRNAKILDAENRQIQIDRLDGETYTRLDMFNDFTKGPEGTVGEEWGEICEYYGIEP